jgi:ribosome-associated heat shock protein Hsp15
VARLLYEDRTPPETHEPPAALREAGAGRPTKRDRREIERLHGETDR